VPPVDEWKLNDHRLFSSLAFETITEVGYKEPSWSIIDSFLCLYTFFSSLFLFYFVHASFFILFLYPFLFLHTFFFPLLWFSYAPYFILFYCFILLCVSTPSFLARCLHAFSFLIPPLFYKLLYFILFYLFLCFHTFLSCGVHGNTCLATKYTRCSAIICERKRIEWNKRVTNKVE